MGVTVIKKIPELGAGLRDRVRALMPAVAAYLQSCADKKIRDGVPPPNAPLTQAVKQGAKTLRDSSSLAASIAPHHGDGWAAAGTNLHYARIQQEGGTVRGGVKGLWIPAGSETRRLMRRYGVTGAGGLIEAMRRDGWTLWRRGKAFFARKKNGQARMLFVIRQSVDIPSRPFLYISRQEEKYILALVQKAVRETLEG